MQTQQSEDMDPRAQTRTLQQAPLPSEPPRQPSDNSVIMANLMEMY